MKMRRGITFGTKRVCTNAGQAEVGVDRRTMDLFHSRLLLVVMAGIASAACGRLGPKPRMIDPATPSAAADASNRFGFDLYRETKTGDENLVLSPLSASVVLTMAAGGARGTTQAEMARVLHLDGAHLTGAHGSFGDLLVTLNARDGHDGVALRLGERIWTQRDMPLRPEFVALMRQTYAAPLEPVDFVSSRELAVKAVNDWAARETHDRIKQILSGEDVTATTRMILVNAVYFKGTWRVPFVERATSDGPFAAPRGKVIAQMMNDERDVAYAHLDGVRLVELPYDGGLSMVVILPDQADDLHKVEAQLSEKFDRWLAALHMTFVQLTLPRFKVTSTLHLAEPLQNLGMTSAFKGNADFSGITAAAQLYIDKVIQKAFIETNERGSEAAAVTAITMRDESARIREKVEHFRVDHPFLYFIRDPLTGAILFMGRVMDPNAHE
jgi:serpin B